MDEVLLAKQMLRWRELQGELADLETSIREMVLEKGETVVVAGVRVTYSKGRTSYDYKAAALEASKQRSDITLELNVRIVEEREKINVETLPASAYSNLAKKFGLLVPTKQSEPTATIKMEE